MIHIEMEDSYSQIIYYYGKLNDKYNFCVLMSYDSTISKVDYKIQEIKWTDGEALEPNEKLKKEAEPKIKDFVMKWLFDRPEEENDREEVSALYERIFKEESE
jgi:hypothetical protein